MSLLRKTLFVLQEYARNTRGAGATQTQVLIDKESVCLYTQVIIRC